MEVLFCTNSKTALLDVRWPVFRMKRICQSNDTQQCFGKTLRWSDSLHRQKGVSGVISAQWWLPPPLVGGFLRRNFPYQDWSAYGWGGIRWFEVVNQKSLGKVAELKTLIWLLPFIRGVSWHSAPNGYWRNHWMEDSKLHRKHLTGKWFSAVLIWRCWCPNEQQQGVGGCDFMHKAVLDAWLKWNDLFFCWKVPWLGFGLASFCDGTMCFDTYYGQSISEYWSLFQGYHNISVTPGLFSL